MKKWLLLIAGAMLITATAQADCGACEGAKKAKSKAECEMKKGEAKAECAKKEAECAKEKAACKMEEGKKKAECAKEGTCKLEKECKDKASEQAQSKRKKWWKFWGSDEAAE